MAEVIEIDERLVRSNLINLRQIVFEVTEKCNLNCKYCGLSDLYQSQSIRKNRDLSFEKAKLTLDYLVNLWKENHIADTDLRLVVSFYGGEPLMNVPLIKKIIDYIEELKIRGRQIDYGMTTNAMLLDKHMDFLAEKRFRLLISLDGDEQAQSYRVDHAGENSFSQVFHNVKLLQRKHPDYFNEFVSFNAVLHNQNDVEPVLYFFKTHFDKAARISTLDYSGVRENKKGEFRYMYQNKAQSLLKSPNCASIEAEHFLNMPKGYTVSQHLYHSSGNIFYNYNQLLLQKPDDYEVTTGTCTPFSKKMFITVDGKILPCERIDYDFSLGHVHDDFVELDYKFVADRHNYYIARCSKQCAYCYVNKFCPQCVYKIDDIRSERPECLYFASKEAAEKEKEQVFDSLRQNPHFYEKVLNEVGFTL